MSIHLLLAFSEIVLRAEAGLIPASWTEYERCKILTKERLVTCACVNSPFCLHATGPPKPEARWCMQPKLFNRISNDFNVFGIKASTPSHTKILSGRWDDPRMHEDLMLWVVTHKDMAFKILTWKTADWSRRPELLCSLEARASSKAADYW